MKTVENIVDTAIEKGLVPENAREIWISAIKEFLNTEFSLDALKHVDQGRPGGVTTGGDIANIMLTGEGAWDI